MTIYLVNYGGHDDGFTEAVFSQKEDAEAFAAEMNKGENGVVGEYEVVQFEVDARKGEKHLVEWRCFLHPADGDTPDNQDSAYHRLAHSVNVKAEGAIDFKSGNENGTLYAYSTRSEAHARELITAEFEAWKAAAK